MGWKGLINDPGLDGTYHINKGLKTARDVRSPPARTRIETLLIYKLSSRKLLHRTIFISNIKVNVY